MCFNKLLNIITYYKFRITVIINFTHRLKIIIISKFNKKIKRIKQKIE